MSRWSVGVAAVIALAGAGYFCWSFVQSDRELAADAVVPARGFHTPHESVPAAMFAAQAKALKVESETASVVATKAASKAASEASASAPEQITSSVQNAVPTYTPEQALAMMQYQVQHDDPRRPEMAPKQNAVTAPTADELASPRRYADYEARQSRSLISAYASVLQQLPALRERVSRGAHDPGISAEDYRQAVEALEQLEMMQARLAIEHPQLLPEAHGK